MIQFAKHAKGYRLTCEVCLPALRDNVFEFFSDASQLEQLTPAWLKFSVVTPTPIAMHEGTLIDYELRVHGIPLRWQSRISRWQPPFCFADEQLHGPYRLWQHLHSFEAVGETTICRDEVIYSVYGGRLVHALFVKRDLRRIFAYRTRALQEIFSTERIQSTSRPVVSR